MMEVSDIGQMKNQESNLKTINYSDMTSSTTSMTSSLSSPIDSGVQLLDSESEATSIMSGSGTGCNINNIFSLNSSNDLKNLILQQDASISNTIPKVSQTEESKETETNEFKCQMDLFEKEFGMSGVKELFLSKTNNHNDISTSDIENQNIPYDFDVSEMYSKHLITSNSSPCLGKDMSVHLNKNSTLCKSLSDDVFKIDDPVHGKLESAQTEADLMNVSLTSYELLDYTTQNITLPIENDQMNVSMSEEVNENLCSQLKTNFETIEENISQEVPVIEPEAKLVEEQIVFRRQRKKKSKSDTPKKRVSFHEDILNSTKIDDIHINHGFITHEPDVSLSFFQRGFIRKPDVVKGRYSWAAEGDAPYYEKHVSSRKTSSDIFMQNTRNSSTSSSSTGSISSSIDEEEDSADENLMKKKPTLSQPKSSCLKKTSNKKMIDTKIVHEEINIPQQKSDNNLLETNIFGSLKNILTFSTSVPLAERGVPEGQEDISVYTSVNETTNRRRSCTNFSYVDPQEVLLKTEPVKKRGNLNLEVAKSNFRLSRSEGFYPNYPVEQELPPNIILCDSNVYEHKGISYSYEYDNFQKTFEQQNKPKSSNLYQLIMKELNFFKKKPKEPESEHQQDEVLNIASTPLKTQESVEEVLAETNESSKLILNSYASSSKLDWSDNEPTLSEHSEFTNSRHLHSPKKKINRNNHYSVQSSFKINDSDSFLSKNETVSRPSTSKSSLIDRFLKNVTSRKIMDAKLAKKHKESQKYMSLYIKDFKKKFKGYDEVDKILEKEIIDGLKLKEKNSNIYDKKMITQLKKEVFTSQLETFIQLFMVRSTYNTFGVSKPLLAIITNTALYIASLENGHYQNHFSFSYTEFNTILIGPSGQTIHFSNFKQDLQCMIITGCSLVTNELIGQLEMAMRRSVIKPELCSIKQLCMQDMENLRRAILKQTTVQKEEEYLYYSIVDIQELNSDVVDISSVGPTKEGPLMFKITESNSRWETAYFILKAGILYMLSSASHRTPMKTFHLTNGSCQGARRLLNSSRPHTFQLIINGKSLYLAAPDEYVASEWLQVLIHAANGINPKDAVLTQSCSLLMTTDHILTVREEFPCIIKSLLPEKSTQNQTEGTKVLSCAAILDLVSFRLPSAEQSWCILEFACREVFECSGDWILYFSSNFELENFIIKLENLWSYNNENDESFPLSMIPETDPLSRKCVEVYMSLKDSWSSNTVHLQFL